MIGGRYKIQKLLGEGGMGVVYQALDMQVDRDVAIKLMRRESLGDRKFITRFRRELEVTSQFRHPSTIRVYEHGETEDGRPYMVMELLTGESLSERLERGKIPELQALQYAKQIAESLSEAHEHDVYHRDLKPDNLFIETVGVTTVVKVLDFGIAGGADALKLTQAGEVFGTPQYMSPEQCNGQKLDHRTDIYSLGVILYEMIEGRPPFSADTPMATMLKHVRAKVPPPRYAHPATAKLLMMALRKDRTKRIQTAGRFAELLGQAMGVARAAEEGRAPPANDLLNHTPMTLGNVPSGPQPTPGSVSPTAVLATVENENRGKAMVALLGLAAVAVVILTIVFAANSGETAAGETEAGEAEGGPTAPLALPFSRPVITANVESAEVWVDNDLKCTTPCEIAVPVGDDEVHEIRLRKSGYVDSVVKWRPLTVTDSPPPIPDLKPLGGSIEVGKKGKKKR
ncbi:MAG: serine/threonine protein kinase [Myxococcales bacterium]|nr:serine/threonine protein kinase [Myxococcales bacterium]MCB9705554.1 serine/threonine protein kinase [Myxococcales bacterium]